MIPLDAFGTVLVTGGRGRLGRLLVDALRRSAIRTVSLGRSAAEHPDDVVVDLRDADATAEAVRRVDPDAIVHLASVLRADDLVAQNDLIDRAVADAARRAETAHVVQLSSGAVYGTSRSHALAEDDPLDGDSPYARSKAAGEELFRDLAAPGRGASSTTLRVFNVAGPAFPDSLVMRLLRATRESPVSLVAPDAFVRDYIHQSDVVRAMVAALASSGGGHRTVNVGSGVAVSTRMLLEVLGVDGERVVELPGEPDVNWADVSRMNRILGFAPQSTPGPAWTAVDLAEPGSAE